MPEMTRPPTTPTAEPFPHIVWHDLFHADLLRAARDEFDHVPDQAWRHYANDHELKSGAPFAAGGKYCQAVSSMLQHPSFVGLLSDTFGIPALTYSDLGGGLHRIRPGGHLDVHVDFNRHDDGRYRRINVLIYLNDDPHSTADLWLCPEWPCRVADATFIRPLFGTVVAFATSETSWHGHPLALEGNDERRSLAAYYYTAEPPPDIRDPHSTVYVPKHLQVVD